LSCLFLIQTSSLSLSEKKKASKLTDSTFGTGQMSLLGLFVMEIKVVEMGNLVDKTYYFLLLVGYLKQI